MITERPKGHDGSADEKPRIQIPTRRQALGVGWVVTDPARCVQCGVCSYNCPAGLDVRRYSWLGMPVSDSRCIACGECVRRCPRGVLHFERIQQDPEHSMRTRRR